jgi:hypothetical protein
MAVNFSEALKELYKISKHQKMRKVRLVNGDVLEGTLLTVNPDMIEISCEDKGAGNPKFTIPVSSILYISDVELK